MRKESGRETGDQWDIVARNIRVGTPEERVRELISTICVADGEYDSVGPVATEEALLAYAKKLWAEKRKKTDRSERMPGENAELTY